MQITRLLVMGGQILATSSVDVATLDKRMMDIARTAFLKLNQTLGTVELGFSQKPLSVGLGLRNLAQEQFDFPEMPKEHIDTAIQDARKNSFYLEYDRKSFYFKVITEDLEEPYPALAGAIAGNYFSLQEHLPISHRDARFIAFEKSPDENRLDFDNVISKIVTSCPAYVYFEWQLPEECFSFVDCLVAITLSQ